MRYHGWLGIAEPIEVSDLITEMDVHEIEVCGNVDTYKILSPGDQMQNGNVALATVISVIVPPPTLGLWPYVKYATHLGKIWEVKDVRPDPPRWIINIGGIYHGITADSSRSPGSGAQSSDE